MAASGPARRLGPTRATGRAAGAHAGAAATKLRRQPHAAGRPPRGRQPRPRPARDRARGSGRPADAARGRNARARSSGALEVSGGGSRNLAAAQQLDADDIRWHSRPWQQRQARGMRRHRDMILLVGRGRDRIDARRMGALLVLGDERRGRHLREHEAGVQARLGRQERRQAGQRGIDQHRDAPLRQRADLADRERQRVGGERHRLGVEVAARQRFACRGRSADCPRRRWLRWPASPRAWRIRSSAAPITCGWQRRQ